MASSKSSCFTPQCKYDVFFSFRGEEDTLDCFVTRLFSLLCRKNLKLFVNEELHGEDEISPALLNAIEESKISVIIFSEQYALSKWCLDELVKILECKKKNGQIVIPVFHRVHPSDVRRQTGSFGDAFIKQANSFKVMPENVQKWRVALKEASNDSVKIRPEGKLVDGIVNDILMNLEQKSVSMTDNRKPSLMASMTETQTHLTSGSKDEMFSDSAGPVGVQATSDSESMFMDIMTEPQTHSTSGCKDEMFSDSAGTFGVQTTLDSESMFSSKEDPVSSPKHLVEGEMTHPPPDTLAMHKSEFPVATLDTRGSAARMSGNIATNLAAENPVPSPKHLTKDEPTHPPPSHTLATHKPEIQLDTGGSAAHVLGKLATNLAEENPISSPKHLTEDERTHLPPSHRQAMPKTEIQLATLDAGGSSAHASGNIATNLAAESPISSPKHWTEDETTHPPPSLTLPMPKSEIQPATLDTEGSAAHVSGKMEVNSDGNERLLPIHVTEFGAGSFQDQGEGQTKLLSNACSKHSVKPVAGAKLGTSNIIAVKSLKRNVQKIFRCLNDVRASKIGVHGVGGIGKTTVLKALISFPKVRSMFHFVVLVTVTRNWNPSKLQNEILRQLLAFGNFEADSQVADRILYDNYEADSQVTGKLLQVLNGKKFLLLLDDVWEEIGLEAVGIPDPSSKNGCKILLASRKVEVCRNMNVNKMIELETLSKKEAWELFDKQVGGIIHSPNIQPFARAIVKGCHGLPLLIIVTGRALMEESDVSVWEHASRKFSDSIAGRYHTKDVIQLLKFSFDHLKDDDTKGCFLHCAMFPEDGEINISELVEYFIQECLITATWADAHDRGDDIVDVLVHASLLQVSESGDSIIIHGLIRDLALGILSAAVEDNQFMLRAEGRQFLFRAYSNITEQSNTKSSSSSSSLRRLFIPAAHQFLFGAGAGLTELPIEERKQAEMVFAMDNELCTLPDRPNYPNLLTLFLQRNRQLREIPPSFFESLTLLKVLNLSNTRIKSLPNTIVYLKNLEFLILRECEHLVVLPAEVGSLVFLEVLDLRGTKINYLPDEIGELASLRYLEVFLYLISRGIILRLQALETLNIVVYSGDKRWYEDVKSVLIEVSNLPKLSSLCFQFPELEHVDLFLKESVAWKGQMLTKFKFVVGHDVKSITTRVPDYVELDYNQQRRCLKFVNGENISLGVCQILARSTAFYVDHHLGVDSLSNFGIDNVNGLKYCIISECQGIRTLVDTKEQSTVVLPSLENLNVHLLWNFTCICEGNLPAGSFAELRNLTVHICPKLEYLFTGSIIRSLTKIERLAVEDCLAIKSIIAEDEIIDSSCLTLPSLKMLKLHYLHGLKNIGRIVCPSLEYISFYDCPQLTKIDMDFKPKDTLIEIKAEKIWWDALEWEDDKFRLHLEDRLTIDCEDNV